MSFIHISIVTTIERNDSISRTREAIGRSDGWISDHTFLSNMATTINFELPVTGTESFVCELERVGFQVTVEGDVPKGDEGDLRGQILFTFVHQEPDLKREVPAFG